MQLKNIPTLVILTALPGLIAGGCIDSPYCPDGCRTETVIGGVEDQFAPGDEEIAYPAPELLGYMEQWYHNPYLHHRFDQQTANRPVGHTLYLPGVDAEHPARIEKGILTVRLLCPGSSQEYNDDIVLFSTDENGDLQTIFVSSIEALNGGRWSEGKELMLRFDLAKMPVATGDEGTSRDIRNAFRTGRLHIYVQDDTAVDFVKLEVEYCIEEKIDPNEEV